MAIMATQDAAEMSPAAVGVGTPTMTVCRRGETSVAAQEAAEAFPTAMGAGLPLGRDGGMWMAIVAAQEAAPTAVEAGPPRDLDGEMGSMIAALLDALQYTIGADDGHGNEKKLRADRPAIIDLFVYERTLERVGEKKLMTRPWDSKI